ncbi:MAG: winged helix-turn-helix domain-containing protein [Polyangiaceae bacterium]|nr:winged helix-turn-helix domain-containing protein [Polyangiaceae bacterium]
MPDVLDLGPAGTVDLRDGRVVRPEGADQLTDIELRLVRYLVERSGTAVSRGELEQAVWGYRPGVLSRTVFTTVGRLRAKLEPDPHAPVHVVTIPGSGYAWAADPVRVRGPARLPVDLAAFVGRAAELRAIEEAIDASRIVSLSGPGGAGKTRLALEVARRRQGRVVFVPLEPLEELDAVPRAVAASMGVGLGGRADPWGELAERTEGELLVVLDNAEHLAGLAELLARWVGACPHLTLLVTTRVRLGLRAEISVQVPPLGVPSAGGELASSEAGTLLLQHARRARPGWAPSGPDADALAALCRAVGGNALALELAAAWLRVLEPTEVLAEVGAGSVLVSLDRDVPARHRSIDATLAASWRLLSPAAAAALDELAPCCGPFDRATAVAVARADLATLSQLVDASLLHRRRADDGAPARFDVHPLVRQHARARLAARSDAAVVRERHARWFLARLRDVVRGAEDGDELEAARALAADHEDVLAAWSDRARAADDDALGGSAWALYRYLDLSNRFGELAQALHEAERGLGASPTARAIGLLGAGAGVRTDAVIPHGPALEGVPLELRTAALVHAAIAAQQAGQLDAAELLAGEALTLAAPRSFLAGFARTVRGTARMRGGRLDAAREDLHATAADRATGRGHARPTVHLGELALAAGDHAAARELLEAGLAACRACDDRAFAALALARLAAVLAASGGDPGAVGVEAIEEGTTSRLPRVWWSAALEVLGDHWSRCAARAEVGLVLLAAAAASPTMGPPGPVRARLEASRALADDATWRRATAAGRVATDAELLAIVRRL